MMATMAPVQDPSVLRKLMDLLSDVTGTPVGKLNPGSAQDDTPGWDSIANINFITAVEEEFQISIPTQEALRIHSLADMASFLRQASTQGLQG